MIDNPLETRVGRNVDPLTCTCMDDAFDYKIFDYKPPQDKGP